MGKHFGNLQKITGVVYYNLSPLEVKPIANVAHSLKQLPRRILNACVPAILPFVGGYVLYDWATKANIQSHRKNPDDFKNDV